MREGVPSHVEGGMDRVTVKVMIIKINTVQNFGFLH